MKPTRRKTLRVDVGRPSFECYLSTVTAYDTVKKALQDLIAPQLESIKGEIAALRGEMGEIRGEVRGNHTALTSEIRRIDDKLTWALDLRERIVALETKLGV